MNGARPEGPRGGRLASPRRSGPSTGGSARDIVKGMTERAQDVLARLRALPPEERRAVLELADADDDGEIPPERMAEIRRRAQAALDGTEPGIPWETVRAELRATLGLPAK